jgi:hypothetical protein
MIELARCTEIRTDGPQVEQPSEFSVGDGIDISISGARSI